jgi:succinyl-CoA synthetase beta subunit
MRLLEHEGRDIFSRHGIHVAPGKVARSAEEAVSAANALGYPVVIKAQVLTGGRGKAGGIKIADDEAAVKAAASKILGLTLNGETTESLLICAKTPIDQELYAGVTFDPANSLPVVIFSVCGGMDIEEVAKRSPHQVFRMHLLPTQPVRGYKIVDFLRRSGLKTNLLPKVAEVVEKLIAAFEGSDATTAEINPLAVTPEGEVLALDAKVVIDDSALPRQELAPKFEGNSPLEIRARKVGLNYVQLDGNIAVVGSGAGLAMATMDLVSHFKAKPACFVDTGGGISAEKMAEAVRIALATPGVKGLLVNAFGGINNCAWMARGISCVIDEDKPKVKIVVKMRGHSQDEGWKMLEDRNIPIIKFGTTEEAVEQIVRLVGGGA